MANAKPIGVIVVTALLLVCLAVVSIGRAPTGGSALPSASAVGPRVALTSRPGGRLAPGDYRGISFSSPIDLPNAGRYTFTDCELGFNAVFGTPGRTVLLDHCKSGGIYFEDGGQAGWTMRFCYAKGANQGLRPKGVKSLNDFGTPTPFVVEDTIVENTSLGTPAAHVEAMQSLGGNSMRFTRVRFITHGPKRDGITGQTAAVNHGGGDCLFDSCEFQEPGAFYYTIYSDGPNNVFRRCKVARGAANYVYPTSGNRIAPTLVDCVDASTGKPVKP